MIASIVLCTRNRYLALRETLECLNAIDVPAGLTAEVVVVDNGSTDETSSYLPTVRLRELTLRVIQEPSGGKAVALNTALRSIQGELIAFLDDDVRPARQWLERITRPIVEGRLDAVAGAVRIPQHLRRAWMKAPHLAWLASTEPIGRQTSEFAVGANMACSRKVLARVPAFDPELGPGALRCDC
jgi:glycosyltransferase involved in cell wall biosynthesis